MAAKRRSIVRASATPNSRAVTISASPEPDFLTACQWWPDLTTYWTTLGWKHHIHHFSVLFNGGIVALPDLTRRHSQWKDQGVHLRFQPPSMASGFLGQFDDRLTDQGWTDDAAPVLWSRRAMYGIEIEQRAFAHIPGGCDTVRGDEPLFAWVRFRVLQRLPALKVEMPPYDRQGVAIIVNKMFGWTTMSRGHSLLYDHTISRYPRKLTPDPAKYDAAVGWRMVEPDGRVRFGIAAGADCIIDIDDGKPIPEDLQVQVWLPCTVGAKFDFLLPIVPADRAVFDTELMQGYDAALREANRYWAKTPVSAARVRVPEAPINESIKTAIKSAQVISERNPADGMVSAITSGWTYSNLWPTPNSLTHTCLLDPMGHHDVVAEQVALFKRYQGSVKPPGDAYQLHSGYFSSPKTLTSIDWLSDHGAILYSVAQHVLLSGDRAFLDEWLEPMVKACAFIKDSRAIKGHGGVEGILPPAVATDRGTQIQGLWNDGWNYKGYTTAIRLLRRLKHARAQEFAADAQDYRWTWVEAFRKHAATMPTWTDRRGKKHHFVPTAMSGDISDENRHAFYLDTGPLFLVYSGLVDANDLLMVSTRLWFREGPQWSQFRHESGCWQVPVLVHEMSSCEPCYSWVGFHSWQLGDKGRFLEAMYSLLAGAFSRQTWSMCETRGGIMGCTPACQGYQFARLAVIDDQIKPGELHLLRLVPSVWISCKQETAFENMPTEHGPVSLRWRLSRDGGTLRVAYEPRFRSGEAPGRVVLHVPKLAGLKAVTVNGAKVKPTGAVVIDR